MMYVLSPMDLRRIATRFNPHHAKDGKFAPGAGKAGSSAVKPYHVTNEHLHAAAGDLATGPATNMKEASSFRSRFTKEHGDADTAELVKDVENWQNSAGRLRTASESVLANRAPVNGFERKEQASARTLMSAIHNGASAPTLHRGVAVTDRQKFLGDLQKKGTMDIGLASFSGSERVGKEFAGRGDTRVVFHLAPGARALHVAPLSKRSHLLKEQEWVTGGRFRVGKITAQGAYVHVELHQVATFHL